MTYIDDSGTKGYADAPGDYGNTGKSRYFVFGAVLLCETVGGQLTAGIAALKQRYFGTDQVEVKSNWLRIPHEQQSRS